INNAQQLEGNTGTTNLVFTVSLSAASPLTTTVDFQTIDGAATTADHDYLPTTGTLTFAPGVTTQTIAVPIVGDTRYENDEAFTVLLSNAQNATITEGQGTGIILNDD